MSYYKKYLKYKIKYFKFINNVNKLKGGNSKEYIEGLSHINNGEIKLAITKFEQADKKNDDNMARQHLFDIYTIGREGIPIDLCKANEYLEKITDMDIKNIMIALNTYFKKTNIFSRYSLKDNDGVKSIIEDIKIFLSCNVTSSIDTCNNNKYVIYMNFILGINTIEELINIQDEHELSLIILGDHYKKENDFNKAIFYYKKAAKRNLFEGIFNSGKMMAEYSNERNITNIFFNRVINDSNFKLASISDLEDKNNKVITEYYNDMKLSAEYWLIKLGEYEYQDCILNIDFINDKFIIDVSNIDYHVNLVQEVLYSLVNQNKSENILKGYIIHSYTTTQPIYMRIPDLNELYFKRNIGKQEPDVVDQTVSAAINYEALNLKGTLYVFSGDGNCKMNGLKGKNYFAIYRSVKNVVENGKEVCIVAIENTFNILYKDLAQQNKNLKIMFLSDFIKSTIKPNNFFILTTNDRQNISNIINKKKQSEEICPTRASSRALSRELSRASSPSSPQSRPQSRSGSPSPPPSPQSRSGSPSPPPPQSRSGSPLPPPPPPQSRSGSPLPPPPQSRPPQIGTSKSKPRMDLTSSLPFGWSEICNNGKIMYNSPLCDDYEWKEFGKKPWDATSSIK